MRQALIGITCLVATTAIQASNSTAAGAQEVKGVILKVTVTEKSVRILVEWMRNDRLDKITFHVTEKSKLVWLDKRKATTTDLKVGQKLSIRYPGEQALTEPPQAWADEIIIELAAAAATQSGSASTGNERVMKGVIKEVGIGEEKASILVEEVKNPPHEKIWFHLKKDALILFSDKEKATFLNLKVGEKVTVKFKGHLAETAPPQGFAHEVVIERQPKSI